MTRHQKLTLFSGQRLKKTCYTCLLNLAPLFNCKHAVAVRQMQICMDLHFAVDFKRQEKKNHEQTPRCCVHSSWDRDSFS